MPGCLGNGGQPTSRGVTIRGTMRNMRTGRVIFKIVNTWSSPETWKNTGFGQSEHAAAVAPAEQ